MSGRDTALSRGRIFLGVLLFAAVILLARALSIQGIQHRKWTEKANAQVVRTSTVPAPRGSVFDRTLLPLAISQERYRIAFAPGELTSIDSLLARMGDLHGADTSRIHKTLLQGRKWVVLPGLFGVEAKATLKGRAGVYLEPTVRRAYPESEVTRSLLGVITDDGRVLGGIEQAGDSLLRGRPGKLTLLRDAYGRTRDAEHVINTPALAGTDIVLTLDAGLQDIALQALKAALDTTDAEGGDVVVIEAATGDLLAAASIGSKGQQTLGYLNAPYEPGSVLKPLIYAALVQEGKLRMDEKVYCENGKADFGGRTITDVHPYGWLTFAQALTVSSNIGAMKAAQRLAGVKEYEYLRQFGFGQKTGLGLPGETPGRLPSPKRWSRFSAGSMAIGYEIGVTPVQLANAYAALANGGTWRPARIIKATRTGAGTFVPKPVPAGRRVVSEETSRIIRGVLADVVKEGTGQAAALEHFSVAGKTGTSRAWGKGGYDGYYASFAGYFPAESPQIAFVIRIIKPHNGVYYGGAVAAPVARSMLEALLAVENPPIAREVIAQGVAERATVPPRTPAKKSFRWDHLRTRLNLDVTGANLPKERAH